MVYELKNHRSLVTMRSFKEGFFYIQDPSTLLAVSELNPQPGETVLDLCAAPGGKTTFMAQRMKNQGRIVAQDNQPVRLQLIEENCRRLGVTSVNVSATGTPFASKFDRILVDAPCSNTGVLRRRVDLRWRIRPEEIERLSAAQLVILRNASAHLKSGGTLVYSTCSLEPEENGTVARKFLAENPGFKLENERQLLPFEDGVDGAYVARFVKS
jgi:16S rRNA (cytosine967-C5)-methyltransferase